MCCVFHCGCGERGERAAINWRGRVTSKGWQAVEGAVAVFPQQGHEGEGDAWASVQEDAGGRGRGERMKPSHLCWLRFNHLLKIPGCQYLHSVATLVAGGRVTRGFPDPSLTQWRFHAALSLPGTASATQKMLAHNLLKKLSCDLGLLSCSMLHLETQKLQD